MINNEQIQTLKAAADATQATEWEFHERYLLSHAGGGYVSINGVEAIWCLNKAVGGMAHSKDVLRYIAAANPTAILSLLAERDADKALIAEQAKRIAELSSHLRNAHAFIENTEAFGGVAATGIIKCGGAEWNIDASKAALSNSPGEARTLTVKLPQPEQWSICEVLLDKKKVIAAIREACAAAGITLVVGGE